MRRIQTYERRWEHWLIGWAFLAEGLVTILTLAQWRPAWGSGVIFWSLMRHASRAEAGH